MKNQIIEKEGKFVLNDKFINCTIISKIPKQMCFKCKGLYEAYLTDDEIWNTSPKMLRNRYICSSCLQKYLIETS